MFAFLFRWAHSEERACFPVQSTKKVLMVLSALKPGRSNLDQASQDPIQLNFGYLQGWSFHSLSEQLSPSTLLQLVTIATCCLPSITENRSLPPRKRKSLLNVLSLFTGQSSASCTDLGAVNKQGTSSSARSERPWPAASRSCIGKTECQMLKGKEYIIGIVMW